jgi:hypothetical protein
MRGVGEKTSSPRLSSGEDFPLRTVEATATVENDHLAPRVMME